MNQTKICSGWNSHGRAGQQVYKLSLCMLGILFMPDSEINGCARTLILLVGVDDAIEDSQLAAGNLIDHFWIQFAFGGEDSFLQDFSCVTWLNFDRTLRDDRTVVVFVVDKVNGATRNFATIVDDCLVDSHSIESLTAERRDQTGVYVDDSVSKVSGNDKLLQKSAEYH